LTTALAELQWACPGGARDGEPGDSVDGVVPDIVVHPRRTEEAAQVMRVAASHGLSVVARGAGTKLDWGNPPESARLVIDLSQLAGVVEHESDDLVARVNAGTTLANLFAATSRAQQCFPVDEVVPGSTIGGVVATGLSGPGRHLHGAVRDLVLGATVVRADGVVAHAGSKVVKNVAGYDLAKLFTGSYGTLGVLTEVTLKLKPMPAARRFVVASYPGPADLVAPLQMVLASQAVPSAIEVERPSPDSPVQLAVLVEGRPRPVEQRSNAVAALLGTDDIRTAAPSGWGQLPGPITLKLTSVLSGVPALVQRASSLALDQALAARIAGSAGSGVLFIGLPTEVAAPELIALVHGLRSICADFGGHATVLRAPAALKSVVDVWGPVPGVDLMRRLKEKFDPARRLAPGRFVGGI
jgi:glycolate oxidase FAD binding subunit